MDLNPRKSNQERGVYGSPSFRWSLGGGAQGKDGRFLNGVLPSAIGSDWIVQPGTGEDKWGPGIFKLMIDIGEICCSGRRSESIMEISVPD